MKLTRLIFTVSAFVLVLGVLYQRIPTATAFAPGEVRLHYSPQEDLQQIDVALIYRAERNIDVACYILTSWPIMQALARAADRGVHVRIVLDRSELARDQSRAFAMLRERQGVSIRVKHDNGELLHLKSFVVDGRWLRDGSANLTPTGLLRQENSLIIIDDSAAAATFTRLFERLFSAGDTLQQATTQGLPKGWIP